MPSTRASSAALRNGPALSRKATIFAARRRPIPEIRSRSAADPRLITSVVTDLRWRCGPDRWSHGGRAGRRGGAEKARFGAIRLSLEGPIPSTRRSAAVSPKGPPRFRSSTMRRASPGPTPGSRWSSCADARSTSMRSPRATGRARRTRLSRRASAAEELAEPARRTSPGGRRASDTTTRMRWPATPSAEQQQDRAMFGRQHGCECRKRAPERAHPKSRPGYFFAPDSSRITAIMTSPTACRLCALSLSGVSSTVCHRLLLFP